MNIKKLCTFLLLFFYLISGSVFVHALSMNHLSVSHEEQIEPNCGHQLTHHKNPLTHETGRASLHCFEKCFGDYDDFSAYSSLGLLKQTSGSVGYFQRTSFAHNFPESDSVDPPPDGRRELTARQTPYFSHKDTVKIE